MSITNLYKNNQLKYISNNESGFTNDEASKSEALIQREAEIEQLERWDKGEETPNQKLKHAINLAKAAILGGSALLGTGKVLENVLVPQNIDKPAEVKYSYPKPITEAQKLKNLQRPIPDKVIFKRQQ
jgi:hypothetical protein